MPLFSIPRTRSGAHAGREANVLLSLTRKCWNVGEGLEPYPTGQESKAGHGASTLLRATGHEPLAVPSPSPRTTYHALRTRRADTRVRPCDEITHITSQSHRPRATGHFITTHHAPRTTHHALRTTYPQGGHTGPPLRRHKPQATCRRFVIPAGRAFGSR